DRSARPRRLAVGTAGADAELLGVARRRAVFSGRDAGHADSPALPEVLSRFERRDQSRAYSAGAGSPGLRGRRHGGSRSRRPAGGTLGRRCRRRARGPNYTRHATRTADRPPPQAVFLAGWACAGGLRNVTGDW